MATPRAAHAHQRLAPAASARSARVNVPNVPARKTPVPSAWSGWPQQNRADRRQPPAETRLHAKASFPSTATDPFRGSHPLKGQNLPRCFAFDNRCANNHVSKTGKTPIFPQEDRMEFAQVVQQRRSIRTYDPSQPISDAELRALFELVRLTPSSFNVQHWRFVVVRDQALKTQLRAAALGQEQVETASAVVVVLGKLNAYEDAARIYADTPPAVQNSVVPMIGKYYADAPALQRDEAIRSASLAAMTLMLAARDRGFATGPMIGFDPPAVCKLLGIDANHLPVMLVVIGRQVGEVRPRATRLPTSEIVRLERFDGPGLD